MRETRIEEINADKKIPDIVWYLLHRVNIESMLTQASQPCHSSISISIMGLIF